MKKDGGVLPYEPDEKLVLRKWFEQDSDSSIYKVLFNYFSAVKDAFPDEWDNYGGDYILSKTTGFGALFKAFYEAFRLGIQRSDMSQEFFYNLMKKSKEKFDNEKIILSAANFGSGEASQTRLANLFMEAWDDKLR